MKINMIGHLLLTESYMKKEIAVAVNNNFKKMK